MKTVSKKVFIEVIPGLMFYKWIVFRKKLNSTFSLFFLFTSLLPAPPWLHILHLLRALLKCLCSAAFCALPTAPNAISFSPALFFFIITMKIPPICWNLPECGLQETGTHSGLLRDATIPVGSLPLLSSFPPFYFVENISWLAPIPFFVPQDLSL